MGVLLRIVLAGLLPLGLTIGYEREQPVWDLVEQGGLCSACYTFPHNGSSLVVLNSTQFASCSERPHSVPLKSDNPTITLVADPLQSLLSGNSYHFVATFLRIAMIAIDYRENGIDTDVIFPEAWTKHPWFTAVFEPTLERIGVKLNTHRPNAPFCLRGWSIPAMQRQPFSVENVFLARTILENACGISLVSVRPMSLMIRICL